MASGRTHKVVGVMSGGGAALYKARRRPPRAQAMETVGGIIGGHIGGLFPDFLEPATCSWHRSVAHSWTVLGLNATAIARWADGWQEHCRAEAARHDQLARQSPDQLQRLWHGFLTIMWELLSGFTVGFLVGYGSHLVLDAATRRSLPLLA